MNSAAVSATSQMSAKVSSRRPQAAQPGSAGCPGASVIVALLSLYGLYWP
jgi:hypothetical protein